MGSNHYNQVYLNTTVFAITPPFTQLNTPYPATAYLKGFLNTKAIACRQADLGIEVILELYSKKGFEDLFAYIEKNPVDFSDNALRIIGIDPHFGFSRYAERLGRSANSFDEIYQLLQHEYSYIDLLLVKILEIKMTLVSPKLVAISVPFPGNLFSAFLWVVGLPIQN